MKISAAIIDALIAAGATAEMIAAAVKADLAEEEAKEAVRLEHKRSVDAERQRRFRGRNAKSRKSRVTNARHALPSVTQQEQKQGVEAAFEIFWKAYPRREGDNPRKPALAAYQRAVAHGATPEAILAAEQRLSAKHPTPTRFVPQAATWLNQERWADVPSEPVVVKLTTVEEIQARVRREQEQEASHG